ncbi:hypothetical protein [Mycolicibacterium peregrinum]|uniref:hypothetical protein n=1 Tax=Mycolicibacterium peregrinum TaxID=43304 RepID=UPI001054D241|nr:hypothetical protein [Mycolicibacterium peregrinum]
MGAPATAHADGRVTVETHGVARCAAAVSIARYAAHRAWVYLCARVRKHTWAAIPAPAHGHATLLVVADVTPAV